MTELPKRADFPHQDYDKLRYGDMDTLGHVNNSVFATLFETGRAGLLSHPGIDAWAHELYTFVIARLEIDYRNELRWPGLVHIGTAVKSIGNSSLMLEQGVYKDDICVATANSVMVHVDKTTHRPCPISESMRRILMSLMRKGGPAPP